MPNFDGTGPLGRGSGTGRLRGKCAAGRGNNKNFLAADKDVETSLVTRSEVQEAEGSVY